MNWLSPESKFMEAWNNTTDGILINLLMLVTSIPLVTIGASLTAGHVTARKTLQGEGSSVVRTYWAAFTSNFVKATLLWIPYLLCGVIVAYMWLFVRVPELLIIQYGLSIVWLIGFEWTFAVQARFDNTVALTWFNSLVFGVHHIVFTLILVAIDALFVALVVATVILLPPALFLVIVCGYGSALMFHIPFTERVFARYIS
ncbi:DUF624 domain-containing protein [Alloscardovia omnicolens]|uniref:DUF624 domain-containing protein n=1 Tax=Alloscardovia omnicolens TaxID=419015 RepID=UPI003A650D00